jgi:4-hydroxybenzoyl-CoA thioesterase
LIADSDAHRDEIVLRFLAAPMDITYGGTVHGGKLLEWIDKAGYACAVGWSGHYCVTAYVGDVHFTRPVGIGDLVEVTARLVHTGRSSMHIVVVVTSADPKDRVFTEATRCLTVFVAVDESGTSVRVPEWRPSTDDDAQRQLGAIKRVQVRADIEAAMKEQTYSDAGTAPRTMLRFLAAPTDINWGGKVHGGTVTRWIDEAAYVCAVGWSRTESVAVYAGGVRFYRPIQIGSIVETEARLVHTRRTSMHISVHVRSGDPTTRQLDLTTHCLIIFVALDESRRPTPVLPWEPKTAEDVALDRHAEHLIGLRTSVTPFD